MAVLHTEDKRWYMVNKMVLAAMLMAPCVTLAEWLDDVVALYEKKNSFDRVEAWKVIDEYREKDEQKCKDLECNAAHSDTKGFWGTVRGGSYEAELALLRKDIESYKKLEQTILELSHNKKQEDSFVHALKKLSRYKRRIEELRSRYRFSHSALEKGKLGTVIAAKEVQLATYKAYVKNILL